MGQGPHRLSAQVSVSRPCLPPLPTLVSVGGASLAATRIHNLLKCPTLHWTCDCTKGLSQQELQGVTLQPHPPAARLRGPPGNAATTALMPCFLSSWREKGILQKMHRTQYFYVAI